MEYCFHLFGILLLSNEAATGDRDKFTEDGMSSASRGKLCWRRGGEAHEYPLSKTQKETLFLLENETSPKIIK